jgi:hypothetical protein
MNQETALVQAAQAEGLLPDAATSVLNDPAPSWVVTALSFVGAQFAVWPFLLVLASFGAGVFFELPGSLMVAGVLIAGAVGGLRSQAALFVMQLCVTALLVGLGLLHLGITSDSFQVIIGLLTVLAGFEIMYAAVESSALVTALLAVVNLGLALAGAYFMNIDQEKPS